MTKKIKVDVGNTITINGMSFKCIDGDICIGNGVATIDGKEIDLKDETKVIIEGNVQRLVVQRGSAEIHGDVEGDVDVGGSISCKNVGGDIDAGGSVTCGDVEGEIDAGGSVTARNVKGDIDAGGSVNVG